METLIALFVVALLATAGGIMLTQSLRSTRMIEERGADATELQTAMSVLRDDFAAFAARPSLAAATSDLPTRFEGRPVRADSQIIAFVRNGWSNPGDQLRSDLQRMEYRFDNGSLIRRSWSAPDAAPGTPISDQVLLTGVNDISVRYGWEETWKAEWIVAAETTDTMFPDKVELIFTFGEGDTLKAMFRLGRHE